MSEGVVRGAGSGLADRGLRSLTGVERFLDEDDIIVSKTDTRGILTYVNDTFLSISGYAEPEMIGKPHSVIRHPDMPRVVFKWLWETIASGREIFAYVMNRCKNGDHYWVLAHVTPVSTAEGEIVGYHSNRRRPPQSAIDVIVPLYRELSSIERDAKDARSGLAASERRLVDFLEEKGCDFDQFVLLLYGGRTC